MNLFWTNIEPSSQSTRRNFSKLVHRRPPEKLEPSISYRVQEQARKRDICSEKGSWSIDEVLVAGLSGFLSASLLLSPMRAVAEPSMPAPTTEASTRWRNADFYTNVFGPNSRSFCKTSPERSQLIFNQWRCSLAPSCSHIQNLHDLV